MADENVILAVSKLTLTKRSSLIFMKFGLCRSSVHIAYSNKVEFDSLSRSTVDTVYGAKATRSTVSLIAMARYTLVRGDTVDRTFDIRATKSTDLAMSTATSCRIRICRQSVYRALYFPPTAENC